MNYAKKMDNGGILLIPREFVNRFGPDGLQISPINLSRTGLTIHWFMDFLTEKEGTPDEYESSGRVYHAYRDTEGVSIKDTRDGGFVSEIKFSLREIPNVLEELQKIMAEESAKEK